jgi:hypothetical protein
MTEHDEDPDGIEHDGHEDWPDDLNALAVHLHDARPQPSARLREAVRGLIEHAEPRAPKHLGPAIAGSAAAGALLLVTAAAITFL